MNIPELIKNEIKIGIHHMKHLKFEKQDDEYIVSLVDVTGYEILKGYGDNFVEAINDLHSNLL
ncbi:MAG: hypothetical protein AB8F94_10140 [Saprospiraceae bacterium]